jgi:hypothetical protein
MTFISDRFSEMTPELSSEMTSELISDKFPEMIPELPSDNLELSFYFVFLS